ncbi:hypothetical protein GGR54DRAFT_647786 [Hypoxylon sp. NC1633]|nr:hypothetical protein GGR54DRAFT_647786 [Hypoxylon sp. NC1633]
MFARPSYTALPAEKQSTESEIPLLNEDVLLRREKQGNVRRWLHWVFHGISFAVIVGLLISLYFVSETSRIKSWNMFNYYSPVNEAVAPHPYVHKVFNGSLWYQSPWKGPPTDEVEKAWYSIMQYGMISVTKEDIEKVKHPDWSAQFPPEAGDYIWQDHYMEYFPKTQDKKQRVPEMYERHYEHCVDYIRQSLMCQFDTGIIPYNWVLDHQNPTPNANTHHTCVNWEALQDWLGKRAVEVPEGFVWSQPEDAIAMGWNP